MQEDAELLRRYADSRDQRAFAELVDRHVNQVYASALRRTGQDAHLAADAVQLVFIALARQSRWLVSHPALSAWLHLATRNHAANLVRGESRRKRREQEVSLMKDEISFPLITDEQWKDATPALDEALDQLRERDRAAVLLRFVEKRSYAEIGAKLDLQENAARRRVDRALEHLRAALARKGIVSTATLLSAVMTSQSVGAAPVQLVQTLSAISGASTPSFFPSFSTFYQLMTTPKTAAAAGLSALALFLCTVTVYESSAASRASYDADDAFARAATAASQAEQLSQQASNARGRLVRLQAEAENLAKTTTKLSKSGESSTGLLNPALAGADLMRRHPEVKTALINYNQAHVATRYQALFNALHLSPAQIDRLKALLSIGSTYSSQMENDTVLTFKLPDEISFADAEKQVRGLLGENGYKQYQSYNAQRESRDLTTNLSQALVFSNEPLSTGQSDSMVALLTAAETTIPGSKTRSIDWTEAMNEAKAVLTPFQWQSLQAVKSGAEYNQALFAFEKTMSSGNK